MSIAVNSIPSIVSAQGVAGDVAFQPGSVIAARVLQVSPDNQARISIGGQSIDVQTQVPLRAGQTLQLAVSQTADGIRLAVLPQQAAASGAALAADMTGDLIAALPASETQLAARQAVANAAQTAVTRQAGLSALFANLGAATSLQNLPPKLQQAVADVLAQRPPLDTQLTGDEMKSAFRNSGLFLEARLANGAPAPGAMPDMKAALIVLKQALATALGGSDVGASATPPAASGAHAAAPSSAQAPAMMVGTNPQAQAMAAAIVPAVPKVSGQDSGVDPVGSPIGEETADLDPALISAAPSRMAAGAAPAAIAGGAAKRLLDSLQAVGKAGGGAASLVFDDQLMTELLPTAKGQAAPAGVAPRPGMPPPLRGGLPAAQPMVQPTLLPNMPVAQALHHLMNDTDAALARQTLHQVASLPDRIEGSGAQRFDQAAPRWSFEIPFAMPQGTAVAQFEIARDGGQGSAGEAATQVWRARFSLDIEPAGPVHALVSLTGDKTSVRMWAERPATALQLQAGTAELSQALIRAKLQPGDIVVREGAPVQPPPTAAGHFLDRAL